MELDKSVQVLVDGSNCTRSLNLKSTGKDELCQILSESPLLTVAESKFLSKRNTYFCKIDTNGRPNVSNEITGIGPLAPTYKALPAEHVKLAVT